MQFNHRTVKGQPRVNPRMPCCVLLNQNLKAGLFPGGATKPKGCRKEGEEGGRGENEPTRDAPRWCRRAPKASIPPQAKGLHGSHSREEEEGKLPNHPQPGGEREDAVVVPSPYHTRHGTEREISSSLLAPIHILNSCGFFRVISI